MNCRDCEGSGFVPGGKCNTCKGTGEKPDWAYALGPVYDWSTPTPSVMKETEDG